MAGFERVNLFNLGYHDIMIRAFLDGWEHPEHYRAKQDLHGADS